MADQAWRDLLAWLEDKGFDRNTLKVELQDSPAGGGRKLVAAEDIFPRQALIRLPHSSLLNKRTIAPLYDAKLVDLMNGTELLSLHLALHRRTAYHQGQKDEELFLPYIRTLPKDFSTVPLWREVVKNDCWRRLVEGQLLPHGLRLATEDVSKRFWTDWRHVEKIWTSSSHYSPDISLTVEDFCWAWLCVNSRCIYYDLESSTKEDNVTLAAIIDMGNHCSSRTETIVDYDEHFCLLSSEAHNPYTSKFDRNKVLTRKGSEILYSYSTHSEYILLAEYGFVLGMPANVDSVLDVTDEVERLFSGLETEEAHLKREALRANNYWGEYHFILVDGEVEVSYRLTMALALFHLPKVVAKSRRSSPRKRTRSDEVNKAGPFASSTIDTGDYADAWELKPFYDLVSGEIEDISPENVRQTQGTLRELAGKAKQNSLSALERLGSDQWSGSESDALFGMVKTIWEGQAWFTKLSLDA